MVDIIIIHELYVVWLIADENDSEKWFKLKRLLRFDRFILEKLNDYNRTAMSAGDHIVKCDFFFVFRSLDDSLCVSV